MNYLIYYCFIIVIISIRSSQANNCHDRYCFITTNANNEKIFDCELGESRQTDVTCFYDEQKRQIMLTSKDQMYYPIDKIASGAFQRLLSGITINKFFFNKFQVTKIDKTDFESLSGVSEIKIENPKVLDTNTFISMHSRHLFVLTISCSKNNMDKSFHELHLSAQRWRVFMNNCNHTITCENIGCDGVYSSTRRIVAANSISPKNSQAKSQICKPSTICLKKTTTKTPIQSTTILSTTVSPRSQNAQKKVASPPTPDSSYDNLMWIVLVLTGINSLVILGILLFLMIWWRRFSQNNANKKHTIILEDGDDTKYLKLSPYA